MWQPPAGPLGRLTAAAAERARELTPRQAELEGRTAQAPAAAGFAAAIGAAPGVAVIAEIKRRSPSRGSINEHLDAVERARVYVGAGATCVSVLTEPREFGGALADLETLARERVAPLLRKDFHVAEIQVTEARAFGASAVLLIARALPPAGLGRLVQWSLDVGVEPLVEVRDEWELEAALGTAAPLIGVNARNLETLEIDPDLVARLIPLIPAGRVAIAESGITTRADVHAVAAAGADAVLVGSALSMAADPGDLVGALASVPRVARGR